MHHQLETTSVTMLSQRFIFDVVAGFILIPMPIYSFVVAGQSICKGSHMTFKSDENWTKNQFWVISKYSLLTVEGIFCDILHRLDHLFVDIFNIYRTYAMFLSNAQGMCWASLIVLYLASYLAVKYSREWVDVIAWSTESTHRTNWIYCQFDDLL